MPVKDQIIERAPRTLWLIIGAAMIWLVVGVGDRRPLRGQAAIGRRPRRHGLRALRHLGARLLARPDGALHLLAQARLDRRHRLRRRLSDSIGAWFSHLILPWTVLALLYTAIYARMTRNNLLETLGEDYIRTARAKGLSERQVIFKHGLRASLTPIVTMFGLDVALLVGGAIITESVFNIQGLGWLAINGALNAGAADGARRRAAAPRSRSRS